jgi:hypothetical protein
VSHEEIKYLAVRPDPSTSSGLKAVEGAHRKAFPETLKDPEFLADAQKVKLDIESITGEKWRIR